jgi:putative phage-type endonuclease
MIELLVQGSPEWRAFRKTKIGASDAAAIMGVSPYKSAYALWEEKLGLRDEPAANPAMKRGTSLEDDARKEFERSTQHICVPQVVQHPEYEWAIASLDGLSFCGKIFIEIKCLSSEKHEAALRGEYPEEYIPQLQHQWMCLPDAEECYYVSYHPAFPEGKRLAVIEILRDDKYIKKLLEKEAAFWWSLQSFEAPKMTDRDYTFRGDVPWQEAAGIYLSPQKEIDELQARLNILLSRQAQARETLIALAGQFSSMGCGVRVGKSTRKGLVDYKAIPELKGVNLDEYRKASSEVWRVTNE